MEGFNRLTPAQAERLAFLAEECGEVIQAIGKILRHGYESSHPDIPERTNRDDLKKELSHVYVAQSLLYDSGDLASKGKLMATYAHDKKIKVFKYMHHQK